MFQALFTPRSGTGAIMPVMRAAVCSLWPRDPASLAWSDPEGSDHCHRRRGRAGSRAARPRAMNVPGP